MRKDIYLALMVLVMLVAPMCFAYTPPSVVMPYFDETQYCGSGSQQQTTGSMTGSTSVLILAGAIDFKNCVLPTGAVGTGITIYHAGSAPSILAPIMGTVTQSGTGGAVTVVYVLVANDYAGGVTAPSATGTTTTSNATLSVTNYNIVQFTPSVGAESYTLYRSISGGGYTYVSTFFDSTPPSTTFYYYDTNQTANGQTWGNGTTTVPDWGSSTLPVAAAKDWCQTTIANGAGTTTINLTATCPSTVIGQIVKHDDTPAFNYVVGLCNTTAGGTILVPPWANSYMGNVTWPDTRTVLRGWIVLDIQGQISITYPITFGSPSGTGYSQNKIRITGGTGGSAAQSQFPWTNMGHINSGFVSPVIHTVYQNSTPLYPFEFDHISTFNRGIGGGDAIVVDGGNSGGTYINHVDISSTGTPLKVGYLPGTDGPCSLGNGFGLYVDHSTFNTSFNGNPLTNCDGWTIDETFGIAYFDTITLIGNGIHTLALQGNDWNRIYEEAGSTPGFVTWDTSQAACNPGCGSNSFRHVILADSIPGRAVGITNTALTSNVATITAANVFTVGETVVVAGTTNGSGALNGTVVVTTASSSSFTFALTHGDISSAVDTGTATPPGSQYFVQTVNGSSTPLGQVDFESVDGVGNSLIGGVTPISSCTINENGPNLSNYNPGNCRFAAGTINGTFVGLSAGNKINSTPNLNTGIVNSYSLSVGPTASAGKPGNMIALQPLVSGNGGEDYFDIFDPSNTVSFGPAPLVSIDSTFNINTIGGFNSVAVTVSALPAASLNSGLRRTVSDSSAITSPGQTCVGGGSVVAQAFSDGAVWHCSY